MRHILAAALALSCTLNAPERLELGEADQELIGNVGGDPNPLTFWWYAGEPAELRPAIECALERIRAATCLPVDVSLDAHHWVRQRLPEAMGGRIGWTTGTWDSSRIALKFPMGAASNCRVLVHEIAQHVLRRRNDDGHIAPLFRINEGLLEDICAKHDCGCFNPELVDDPVERTERIECEPHPGA